MASRGRTGPQKCWPWSWWGRGGGSGVWWGLPHTRCPLCPRGVHAAPRRWGSSRPRMLVVRGVLPRLLDSVGCVSLVLAGTQGSLGHRGRSKHVWRLLTPESTWLSGHDGFGGDGGGPRVHPRPLTSTGRRLGSLWARRQVSDAGLRPGAAPVGRLVAASAVLREEAPLLSPRT